MTGTPIRKASVTKLDPSYAFQPYLPVACRDCSATADAETSIIGELTRYNKASTSDNVRMFDRE